MILNLRNEKNIDVKIFPAPFSVEIYRRLLHGKYSATVAAFVNKCQRKMELGLGASKPMLTKFAVAKNF